MACGAAYTSTQAIIAQLPYGFLYIASFIIYGIIVDTILSKRKKRHASKFWGGILIVFGAVLLAFLIFIAMMRKSDLLEGIIVIVGFWPAMVTSIAGIRLTVNYIEEKTTDGQSKNNSIV